MVNDILGTSEWSPNLPDQVVSFLLEQLRQASALHVKWVDARNIAAASIGPSFFTILGAAAIFAQSNKNVSLFAMFYPFMTIGTMALIAHAEEEIGDLSKYILKIETRLLGPYASEYGFVTLQAIARGLRMQSPHIVKLFTWIAWFFNPSRWITGLGIRGDFVIFDLLSIVFIAVLINFQVLHIDTRLFIFYSIITVLLAIFKSLTLANAHKRPVIKSTNQASS